MRSLPLQTVIQSRQSVLSRLCRLLRGVETGDGEHDETPSAVPVSAQEHPDDDDDKKRDALVRKTEEMGNFKPRREIGASAPQMWAWAAEIWDQKRVESRSFVAIHSDCP